MNLLQTTQIIPDVCFITDRVADASLKQKPKSFESRRNCFFLPGLDAFHVYVCAWALSCFHSYISTRTFRRGLTASVDSCAEIKSAPSEFGGRCRKTMFGVCSSNRSTPPVVVVSPDGGPE